MDDSLYLFLYLPSPLCRFYSFSGALYLSSSCSTTVLSDGSSRGQLRGVWPQGATECWQHRTRWGPHGVTDRGMIARIPAEKKTRSERESWYTRVEREKQREEIARDRGKKGRERGENEKINYLYTYDMYM